MVGGKRGYTQEGLRGDTTTDCSEGMPVIWVVHVPTPTYISLTVCLGDDSGL